MDFKIGHFDVNTGLGYGLTPGSDRLIAKMIIVTDLNGGMSDKPNESAKPLRRWDTRMSNALWP
jgi:hypothetical protein